MHGKTLQGRGLSFRRAVLVESAEQAAPADKGVPRLGRGGGPERPFTERGLHV